MTELPPLLRPERLAPLPVRRRRFAHESLDSYIRRLAAANGTTAAVVRRWLIQTGVLGPFDDHDAWMAAWHALGNLHTPAAVQDGHRADVVHRALCTRCTHGQRASGPIGQFGLICLKHGCWIDPRDGAQADPRSRRAEHQFRHHLAQAGMTMESAELRFAQRLVCLAVDPRWIEREQHAKRIRSVHGAVFAPQVAIAVDLFAGNGLTELTRLSDGRRLSLCADWIASRIPGLSAHAEPWRGGALLSHLILELERAQVETELAGGIRTDILQRLAR